MSATNFDLVLFKWKGDQLVSEEKVAHASADPGVDDAMEDIISSVADGFIGAIKGAIDLSIWAGVSGLLQAFVPGGTLIGTLILAERFIKNFDDTNNLIKSGYDDVINNSNWLCSDTKEIRLQESDEFDCLNLCFIAYGDDEFSTYRPIYTSPVLSEPPITKRIEDHHIIIDNWINVSDLSEGGIYPFVFGARDSGFHFDVAGIIQLTLCWEKKNKPLVSTLKSMNEHIDPVVSSRTLKEITGILGVDSLRKSFDEMTRCRSIQASPVRIFWQNMALFPDTSIEIGAFGIEKKIPLFKGRDRNASLNAFISYLRIEQPDIIGLCEMWVPSEREMIRNSLQDIYPYDELHPNLFCLQGPLGSANVSIDEIPFVKIPNLDGGLMILSKYPIIVSDQHIYQATWGEDSFSAKGILYAGIGIPGFPSLLHCFITHLQSCPTALDDALSGNQVNEITGHGSGCDCEGKQKIFQVQELADFIQSKASTGPSIIMGDFNINAFNQDLFNGTNQTVYSYLRSMLKGVTDGWEDDLYDNDFGTEAFWPGCIIPNDYKIRFNKDSSNGELKAKTQGGNICFEPGETGIDWFDLNRWTGGSRIDFIFSWPGPDVGSGSHIKFGRRRIIQVMHNNQVNASDHYGLRIDIQSIRVRS